jgi:acyl-CoA synthetase (AMP-forming)/AMP-acid ligase II
MPGYVDDPRQTTEALRDGWFRTGDLGFVDDDGYLTLVGRAKEVIFAERERIYPSEVENCLVAHPGVAAAGVYARTDGDGVETAAAAIVPLDGHVPSPAELIGWVAERRGANVAPSEVHLVDDLPVTPSGKIDRIALRESAGRAS